MKILHIIDGFSTGGVEVWLLRTTQYLHEHPDLNVHFDFLVTGGLPKEYDSKILTLGSRIFYCKYSIQNLLLFRTNFRKILKENMYQVIHDHQDFISGWHFILGVGLLPPIRISHLHNPYNFVVNYLSNPVRYISYYMGRALMFLLASKITGTSNVVLEEYGYDKWPFRLKTIQPAYCGFDTSLFQFDTSKRAIFREQQSIHKDTRVALFIGRIGQDETVTAANQKNPTFAFSVAKELISSNSSWTFLFVGFMGTLGKKLQEETIALGIQNDIRFLGLRSDISTILSASDILVFPSFWEGLGMVAVEAQASGLPVIMSHNLPRESIATPTLVNLKELSAGPKEWAKSIINITSSQNDSKSREQISIEFKDSRFSIDSSIKDLCKIYGQ